MHSPQILSYSTFSLCSDIASVLCVGCVVKYVVKQVATKEFVITSGTHQAKVTVHQSTTEIQILSVGFVSSGLGNTQIM